MKKKRILFVATKLELGGIPTALVNAANALCGQYDVTLLVYTGGGSLASRLDSRVTLLPVPRRLQALGMSLDSAWRSGSMAAVLFKLFATGWARLFDNRLPVAMAIRSLPRLTGYDLAIAFSHETDRHRVYTGCPRLVAARVEAKTKLGWIHYDPVGQDMDNRFNLPFYEKMDGMIAVSRSVMTRCQQAFPELAAKMDWCPNFVDTARLEQLGKLPQEIPYECGCFVCFSACRLAQEKGLLRALDAMAQTLRAHPDVRWYIAGDGYQRAALEAAIAQKGLQHQVILLGKLDNPYPYLKHASLYLSPSLWEAAPMVYAEANFFGLPVLSTETCSAHELLGDGNFICGNTEAALAAAFADLMCHREKIAAARGILAHRRWDNASAMEKFSRWLL